MKTNLPPVFSPLRLWLACVLVVTCLCGRAQQAPATPAKPTLYVLAIGVSQYKDSSNNLQFPAKDATDIVTCLQAQEGKVFGKVVVTTLTDGAATRDAILSALVTLRKKGPTMGPDDCTLVLLVGHAACDDLGQYFFAPYNVDVSDIEATGVEWITFSMTLAQLHGHVLLWVDTSHAGSAVGIPTAALLASCAKGGQSMESAAWKGGAFAKALLEGLGGAADDNHDGTVTLAELERYLGRRVSDLTKNAQNPVFATPSGFPADLPLALVVPAPPGAQPVTGSVPPLEKPLSPRPSLADSVGTEFDEHIRHGCDYFTAGRSAEAIAEFEAATALQPKSLLAHQDLASVLYRNRDLKRSADEYQRAADLSTARDVFVNYFILGFVSTEAKETANVSASGTDPDSTFAPALAEMVIAESYEGIRRYDNAVTHYKLSAAALDAIHKKFFRAIHSGPAFVFSRPHQELGFCFLRMGQNQDASDEFNRAIEYLPDASEAHLGLGMAEAGLGKTEGARLEWLKVLRLGDDEARDRARQCLSRSK